MELLEKIVLGVVIAVFVLSCESGDSGDQFDGEVASRVLDETSTDSILAQTDTTGTIENSSPVVASLEEREHIQALTRESELHTTECCKEWEPGVKVAPCCCDSLINRYAYALETDIDRALKILETDPYYKACKQGYKKYQKAIDRLENSTQ